MTDKTLLPAGGDPQGACAKIDWHAFGTITRGRMEKGGVSNGGPGEYLTMESLTGQGGWESAPLMVTPGVPYVLTWSLKTIGPGGYRAPEPMDEAQRKAFAFWDNVFTAFNPEGRPFLWHHFVDFLGVELVWQDASGKTISMAALPMAVERCDGLVGSPPFFEYVARRGDMSADWVPVWLPCQAPTDAARLVVRFAIRSRGQIDAGVALGDVRLIAPPADKPAKGMIRLVVRTLDAQTGKPVPTRLSVRDHAGEHFAPPHSFVVRASYNNELQFFYSLTGEASLDLPLGKYNIEAVAGLDREVAVAQADYVRDGCIEPIELEMVRRLDLRAGGWHCGDHHLHTSGHATRDYPMMDALTGMRLGVAAGMDYFPFQAECEAYGSRGTERLEADGAVGSYSTEICNLWGHYCLISVGEPVPMPSVNLVLYPMAYDILHAINQQGGACMAAHPHQMISQPFNTVYQRQDQARAVADPGRFNAAKGLPLMLLLDEPCGYDLLIADGGGVGAMATREYYRLLDFGFRVPCGGSSDTGIDSARCLFPSCRTYVQAATNELSDIARGYRGGRTFATNGPVMLVDADGAGLGDTLACRTGQELCIRVDAFSPWGLSHVEVVYNGLPVARRELLGHDHACVEIPVTVRRPGWLAVVVRGLSSRWVNTSMWPAQQRGLIGQIAHSSPIYIRVVDAPLAPGADITDYYRRWMDSLLSHARHWRHVLDQDAPRAGIRPDEAWDIIEGRIDQARKRIDAIARTGWPEKNG